MMRTSRWRSRLVAGVAAAVLLVAGCDRPGGSSRRAIHGKVTIGGQPVQKGSLTLLPAEETTGPAANTTIVDGKYEFDRTTGPTPGLHDVIVTVAPEGSQPLKEGEGRRRNVRVVPIEKRTEVTVPEEGSDELDFEFP